MSQNELDRFLLWVAGGIAAFGWFILRSIAKEVWLLVKVPFGIIYSFYQMLVALTELQDQLQIWSYSLEIINNFTSQPLISGTFHSIVPFAGLIWILFGGYIFFKILLPAIIDAL
jgi:hypothetical protein